MKRIIILLALLLPSFAYGIVLIQSGTGGLKDSETGTSSTYVSIGQFGTNLWLATKFTAGSSYTVDEAVLYLKETGDTSGESTTLTAYIYSDDTDEPDTVVGTGSDAVNISSINDGGVETEYTFHNMSAALTASSTYWVVVVASGDDNTNYPEWSLTNTATVEDTKKDDDGLGTWAVASAVASGKYKLYE